MTSGEPPQRQPRHPLWRSRAQLELAVVEYIGWFNHDRFHQALGDLPSAELEAAASGSPSSPSGSPPTAPDPTQLR